MQADNKLILWLVGILVLGTGIILGVIIAKRTRKKETHIRELEEQLTQSREELAQYRTQVDDYFFKTSELVEQMTASYRAVYLHLAEGAHTLCGRDYEAAHLTLAGDDPFDPLPAALGQEADNTRTPAEEEAIGEAAGEGVEAAAAGNGIDEDGEDKTVMIDESVTAENSEVTEPDQHEEGTGQTELAASDQEGRDEK